jgi:hypothetical protein
MAKINCGPAKNISLCQVVIIEFLFNSKNVFFVEKYCYFRTLVLLKHACEWCFYPVIRVRTSGRVTGVTGVICIA